VTLVALDADAIRAFGDGLPARVGGVLVTWPDDDRRVLRYRLEALHADPASAPYLLHVRLEGADVVARVGCHEAPRDGTVEIGYRVAPGWRGAGVGTGLVTEFLAWLAGRGVRRVRAAVRPDNAPSRALLERLGFTEHGEQWDEEDGRELLLERALP
jgi:[ribosomal protein S5]-alanine N-acetyltransferase